MSSKIFGEESNAVMNKRVANVTACVGFVVAISWLLSELELFYLDKSNMRWGAILSLIICLAVQVVGRVNSIADRDRTKYVIAYLTIAITFVIIVTINFHATLILVLPLIVALNYHSRKSSIISIAGALFCSVAGPVLGCVLKTWSVEYFAWLSSCVNPSSVNEIYSEQWIEASGIAPSYASVAFFVCFPYVMCILVFGLFTLITNNRKRARYDEQIQQLNDVQTRILYGMSNMVENRDNETGGHIRRTSDVVSMLVKNLKDDEQFAGLYDEDYWQNIVKAAPLHDLGKIAVSDSILNKPGRLTAEEFDIIKTHPQKSLETIETILDGIEDEDFLRVAGNIAEYHHERYDGTGYPRGLAGDDIPLEARIMAIADVYDALVSERCYKESISHQEAYDIIQKSMGNHFDPKLWKCFDLTSSMLVSYYGYRQ